MNRIRLFWAAPVGILVLVLVGLLARRPDAQATTTARNATQFADILGDADEFDDDSLASFGFRLVASEEQPAGEPALLLAVPWIKGRNWEEDVTLQFVTTARDGSGNVVAGPFVSEPVVHPARTDTDPDEPEIVPLEFELPAGEYRLYVSMHSPELLDDIPHQVTDPSFEGHRADLYGPGLQMQRVPLTIR